MRNILAKASLATLVLLVSGITQAQVTTARYPSKPITIVVPYPAGGVADVAARLVASKLQESWRHDVIVENKVGAGGLVSAVHVARAPADGHTLLFGITGLVLQPQMIEAPPYDPFKDFAPVSLVARLPLIFAVQKSAPSKSVEDFIKWSKSNPALANIGNYGIGTPSHLFSIMLNEQAGMNLPLIPFQGSSPLASNLLGNQISAAILDSVTARRFGDKLTFLAVTGEKRLKEIPNVRTFKEQGYRSFEQDGWMGLLVPAATPEAVVEKLSQEFQRIIATPEAAAEFEKIGANPVGSTPAALAKAMRDDFNVFGKVIKEANIRLK